MLPFQEWYEQKLAIRNLHNLDGPTWTVDFYRELYDDEVRQQAVDETLAKPGVTLAHAENLRVYAWSQPFDKRDWEDWDPVTQSYPARVNGSCRHKATWLGEHLGGKLIYGRRLDQPDAEHHCALLVRIGKKDYVLDRDQTWDAAQYPFQYGVRTAPRRKKKAPPQLDVIEKLMQRIDELEKLPPGQFELLYDGERLFTITNGHRSKSFKMPLPFYRGVRQEGELYEAGDLVTYRGNMWFCLTDTDAKPGTSNHWRLAVKKGRDLRERGADADTKADAK